MTPYIISYLTVGMLLAAGLLLNGAVDRGKVIIAVAVAVLLWPLLLLVAPEGFFRNKESRPEKSVATDSFNNSLERLAHSSNEIPLFPEESASLKAVAVRGELNIAYFDAAGIYGEVLADFWESNIPPSIYFDLKRARSAIERSGEEDSPLLASISFSRGEPDWYVGFSN